MSGSFSTTDSERLATWIRDHGRAVRAYLWAMVRQDAVADDLVQEVFYRAWRGRHRYCEAGSARAYLMRIADRLVVDRSRRHKREVCLDDDQWQCLHSDRGAEPLEQAARAESHRLLADALEELSEAQRRVLLLRYYGDMTFAEIARTMNCPLGTVLSHCRRGLLALRKRLVEVA